MIKFFVRRAIFVLLIICWEFSFADEGMWLINLLNQNIATMQSMGLKLSAEDIYSINHSSLKDAIVQFDDGGCTGELVSAQGLFLTNHHCGVEAVQSQSTTENNLLKNGFWAKNFSEELPIEGKTALILVGIEDVTSKVLSTVNNGLPNKDYFEQLRNTMRSIEEETAQKTGYHVVVKPFYNNNAFYLFSYERFLDVRLVGVPPTSIGNFGGDVDNWHWPRHTGDFCIFRIYSSPDGKPAEYSTKNVPYKSKNFLKIDLKGVDEGDFAMIIGYPGTTHRYATSYEALNARDVIAPWKREVWGSLINVIKDAQTRDPKVKVDYTDKHDYLVNFYQKDTWQAESMFRYRVVERLAAREDSLKVWVNQNPSLRSRYLTSLPVIKGYYEQSLQNKWDALEGSLSALSFYPVDIYKNINAASNFINAIFTQGKPYSAFKFWKKDEIRSEGRILKKNMSSIFDKYYYNPDLGLYIVSFGGLLNSVGDCPNLGLMNAIKHIPDINRLYPYYVQGFYEHSYFTSKENLEKLIKNPVSDSLLKDPLFILYHNYNAMWDSVYPQMYSAKLDYEKAMQMYTKGLMEMSSNQQYYPDANSTMRLTYGKVVGYKPADGLIFKPFTYLDGVMEKENPNNDVFEVDPKLKELWRNKDYGRYGTNGKMPVCFLTDNDITGGNSGSPVLNGDGNLIGIAFDGNAEAMACDYMYEPDVQRTIIVDIRYVLFVVDKFADAQNIINEMSIN
ncbi:MAG: S46 family peptidase [Bacteroidales bacterium]